MLTFHCLHQSKDVPQNVGEKKKTLQEMGDVKDTDDDVSRDNVHYVYFTACSAFCKDMKGRAVKKIPGSERILTSVEQNILHHYL